MKISNYNILTPTQNDEQVAAFNTLSGALMTLDPETDDQVIQVLSGHKDHSTLPESKLQILRENGYMIEDEFNELNYLKVKSWTERFTTDKLHLSILTTLDCNFDCPYCFEPHRKEFLSEEIQQNIVKFVDNKSNSISSLSIDWYGGEPLLNFKAIRYLSSRLMSLCDSKGIDYTCSMTTNGYLLTPKIISELKEMRCKYLQITVDGPPDVHNKTRRLANSSVPTFNRVLGNALDASEYFDVYIRANVDETTISRIPELIDILSRYGVKPNIVLSIKSILSADIRPYDDMRVDQFARRVKDFYVYAQSKGVNVGYQLIPTADRFCIVDSAYQFMISPNGRMFKCSESFSDADSVGNINNDGSYDLNFDRWSRWMSKDPFSDADCLKCKVLPLCFGGCSLKRLEKGGDWCTELKYNIRDQIRLHCELVQLQEGR